VGRREEEPPAGTQDQHGRREADDPAERALVEEDAVPEVVPEVPGERARVSGLRGPPGRPFTLETEALTISGIPVPGLLVN